MTLTHARTSTLLGAVVISTLALSAECTIGPALAAFRATLAYSVGRDWIGTSEAEETCCRRSQSHPLPCTHPHPYPHPLHRSLVQLFPPQSTETAPFSTHPMRNTAAKRPQIRARPITTKSWRRPCICDLLCELVLAPLPRTFVCFFFVQENFRSSCKLCEDVLGLLFISRY